MRFIAFIFLALAACDGPCTQLANKICDCEPDLNSQASCRSLVSLNAQSVNPNLTKADEEYCKAKVEQCDCQKLLNGDRAACGFQRE